MSDLYGTDDRSSFEPESEHGHDESEDMTVFLHNLLQSSPATASVGAPPSMMLDYRIGAPSLINSSSVGAGGGGSFNFSDPGVFFEREAKERVEKAFYSVVGGECDAVTSSMKRRESSSLNKGSEASDSIMNQMQPRSSKRSRSAEVHNLSEKRRRSRINEKLKALQNLIPNSNKTDKASMLDEAIEYLKQLQLQVQMLTMRNGFSLHQNYIPGCLPPIQLPVEFDEGKIISNNNTGRGADVVASGNQEVAMENVFGSDNPKGSTHQLLATSITNNSSSGTSFRLESSSSFPSHYGLLNHLASSKDICRDETLSHLPLNVSCSGNNSSSGVSS